MKKRFALYGMFAAMAIFATACGDDSSSGPDEEESSSSIVAEDESSSAVEEEGKSSAKEEGKSSSSEAKKGDSSSSEKASSSSSEAVSSSSSISYEPTCTLKTEGSVVSINLRVYTDDKGEDKRIISVDYESLQYSQTSGFSIFGLTSCEEAKTQFQEALASCSPEDETIVLVQKFPSKDVLEEQFGTMEDAEKTACSIALSEFVVDTTALNQDMLAAGEYGTFRDTRDAMLYRTIKIGNQTWMAQNLGYEIESGSSCYDDNLVSEGAINVNCLKYGRLYTWEVAKSACPAGWRLPTKADFVELVANVEPGFDENSSEFGNGFKLMSKRESEGTDEIGFSVVLGGSGYGVDYFDYMNTHAYFWSQTAAEGEDAAYTVVIGGYSDNAIFESSIENSKKSVRCIKDDAPAQSISSN